MEKRVMKNTPENRTDDLRLTEKFYPNRPLPSVTVIYQGVQYYGRLLDTLLPNSCKILLDVEPPSSWKKGDAIETLYLGKEEQRYAVSDISIKHWRPGRVNGETILDVLFTPISSVKFRQLLRPLRFISALKNPTVFLSFVDLQQPVEGILLKKQGEALVRVDQSYLSVHPDSIIETVTFFCGDSAREISDCFVDSVRQGRANQDGQECILVVSSRHPNAIDQLLRDAWSTGQLASSRGNSLPNTPLETQNIERIPKTKGDPLNGALTRLSWLRYVTNSPIREITPASDPSIYDGNIEDYIGDARIPLAIAGPILIKGTHINNEFVPVPIATTEGALVSSLTRGARICSKAGGIQTVVEDNHYTSKSPLFVCEDPSGAANLRSWIQINYQLIEAEANKGSRIGTLSRLDPLLTGNKLHINFCFKTADAAGQNMANQCVYIACEWIKEQVIGHPKIKFKNYYMEGNYSGDKKANYHNQLRGKGVTVSASCFIPERLIEKTLRTSKRGLTNWMNSVTHSGHVIGTIGSNVNFANAIAGIFTACGQDIGSVYESSPGIFNIEERDDGVLATAYLPSLVVGTVGGGTGLPTQSECLDILNCFGSGKKYRFAEIVAATCLSLDISTAGAYASEEFARSHENLGRNRPTGYDL